MRPQVTQHQGQCLRKRVMLYGYLERHSSFAVKRGDSLYILFPSRMQDDWQPSCTQMIELHIDGLENMTSNVYGRNYM